MKHKTIYILIIILLIAIVFSSQKKETLVSTISESAIKLKEKIIAPSPNCYHTHSYTNQLNDSVHKYLESSYLDGIQKTLKRYFEIHNYIKTGALIQISDNPVYSIDTLKYSYPFLRPKADKLLHEIGKRFQRKIENTNLKGTRIIVTSVFRTLDKIKKLQQKNKNAIKYSSHLHGTSFDITYSKYRTSSILSIAEIESLKEILAKTLFEMRQRNKCWVTYEKFQTCFHVVNR